MPDVFVPRDTTAFSAYLSQLYNKNVMREFALSYYKSHQKQLEKMSFTSFNKSFAVTDQMLQDIVKIATSNGVVYDAEQFKRSKDMIRNNTKAFIARSIFGNEGFYPVLHQSDDEFQEALDQFGQARRLANGGA